MIYLVAAVVLVFATVAVVHFETWLTKKLGMQRRSQFVSLRELEEDPGPEHAGEAGFGSDQSKTSGQQAS